MASRTGGRMDPAPSIDIFDDDDNWDEMPVLRSDTQQTKLALEEQYRQQREMNGEYSDDDHQGNERRPPQRHLGSSDSDSDSDRGAGTEVAGRRHDAGLKKRPQRRPKNIKKAISYSGQSMRSLDASRATAAGPSRDKGKGKGKGKGRASATSGGSNGTGNGNLMSFDDDDGDDGAAAGGGGVRGDKAKQEAAQDYTRLELDEDPEEDEVHTRTQFLFDDDKGMTPLSQMQTTKQMLTEGQRIAYVGLCRLLIRETAIRLKGIKELELAVESINNWGTKIMGRLYQHMEIEPAGGSSTARAP